MTGAAELLTTVLTFLVLSGGLGSIMLPRAAEADPVEKVLLAIGIGLGTLPLLILLFRVVHVPLDVRIFLTLGIIAAGWRLFQGRRVVTPARATSAAALGALLIAGVLGWIMYVGATKYPYLEDDDPWAHATGAHYVAMQKTTAPPAGWATHYLEPYPPYYTAVMGLLHQLNPDTNHVLKAVNAAMVGLSLVGAFFAFRALTGSKWKALAGAAILGMMPAYMSHFIWSQTLAIPVFFVALWALERTRQTPGGPTWRDGVWWTAVLMMWSATIIQPSTAAVFAVLLTLYVVVPLAWEPKRPAHEYREASALIGAGALSVLTWCGFAIRSGWARFTEQINISAAALATPAGDTSGGVVYGLRDIVFAPATSKIDQATGLGWFVSLLAVSGVILFTVEWTRRRRPPPRWAVIMMVWSVVGILGIEGNALPVKLFPHRFWIFLSIPIALLAADAAFAIGKLARRRLVSVAVTAMLVALAVWSNAAPRLAVQQAHWPPGLLWRGHAELSGYSTLPRLIPVGSRVLVLCSEADKAIGMGMDARPWDRDEMAFKARLASASGDDVARFMQRRGYEYLTVDPGCVRALGTDATQSLLRSLQESRKFQLGLRLPQPSGPGPSDDFFLLLRTAR